MRKIALVVCLLAVVGSMTPGRIRGELIEDFLSKQGIPFLNSPVVATSSGKGCLSDNSYMFAKVQFSKNIRAFMKGLRQMRNSDERMAFSKYNYIFNKPTFLFSKPDHICSRNVIPVQSLLDKD
jgi:hypothetical protein